MLTSTGKNQKASPEFISYLKNTPELPGQSLSKSKENQLPLQTSNPQKEMNKDDKRNLRVVEGDFSKISCCYVLEGNMLRKKQAYDKKEKKNILHEKTKTKKDSESMESRKEFLKLEYLQKMGVLKPEQQEILNSLRKSQPQSKKTQAQNHPFPEDQYPQKRGFLSPKPQTHQKKLSTYFSPNKLMYDNSHHGHQAHRGYLQFN